MKKTMHKEVTLMSTLLCLCVIMIHLTATPVTILTPGSFFHALIFVFNQPLSFAVPGFIFLSGFKLYRQYGQGRLELKRFYLRRFQKVIIPYIISVTVYFICYCIKGWCDPLMLPKHLLLGTLSSHFYYIVIAVQLYLFFPLLKHLLNTHPIITFGLSLISTVTFYDFIHFPYSDRFAGTYVFFFVLGMLAAKKTDRKTWAKYCRLGLLLFLMVGIAHFTLLYRAIFIGGRYPRANTVTVLYVTVAIAAIFGICAKLTEIQSPVFQFAQPISQISYYVYLYHMMVILLLEHMIFPRLALSPGVQFLLSLAVVYGLVFAFAYGVKRRKRSETHQ